VQSQLAIPWIHLMEQTAQFIATTYPQLKRIGILATDGTLRTELYTRSLMQWGLIPIAPMLGSAVQTQVMQSIYHPNWGIKSTGIWIPDQALEQLRLAIDWLNQQGAELVIAGCTELSVALARMELLPLPWVDPLEVAASLTLDLAFGVRSIGSVWAA
jgi:aspartate racemase